MEPLQVIEHALRSLARRRRLLRAIRGFFQGALLGGALWLLALIVFKLAPIHPQIPLFAMVAGVGIAILGFILGGWSPCSLIEVARWVDQEEKLQERLSTAWELRQNPSSTEWRELILRDASRHASLLNAKALLPFRCTPAVGWACAVILLAMGLGFFPEYRSQAQLQKKAENLSVVETGKQLADLTRQQLAERRPVLAPTEKSLNEVLEFGEKLTKVSATRNEALRDLAILSQKLQDQHQKMGDKPALRTLERAAREPSGGPSPNDLRQRMDALKQALGSAAGKNEAMDKLKRNLESLKRSAESAPKGDSVDAKAAQEKLSHALSDLAQQAKEAGIPLASLDEAANALRNSETDFFLRDLNSALQELDKLQQLGQNLQQLQQEMARFAKDLAEQLQQGQAKAAQSTLEKMVQQLHSTLLTPEELQRMVEEVRKSLEPAKQYGQVAGHLEKALESLGKSRPQGLNESQAQAQREKASGHLADAAKELGEILQQMQDADQLAGALETLQRAQLAIANGQGFGQCKASRPGFGPGGKPGRGVGTWADEEGWTQIPEENKGWDNSGIQQPELDSRGVSDRGEGEHNSALSPTKVRGQMSPGGSMQSVTLKGVHIRGQSSVKLQEAATTAQAEAQSALNQDKVPRAYQQGVRHYFDELKP